jgi:hypothetical protein
VIHEEPAFAELFISHLLARNSRVEEDLVDQLFNSSEKTLTTHCVLLALSLFDVFFHWDGHRVLGAGTEQSFEQSRDRLLLSVARQPFGLVMIEAMACGTPALAFRSGSVPEVIEDGVTGKVVDSEEEAIAALPAPS